MPDKEFLRNGVDIFVLVEKDDTGRVIDAQELIRDRLGRLHDAEKITLYKEDATVAVKNFANESIDFIYVDAVHDYCSVSNDMKTYYPVLKCGGKFAGHDYVF